MRRFMLPVVGVTVLLLAGPALAFQCPKLVKKIEDETATRYDPAAADAKAKAAQASELHAQGKHAEAEKAAKEALAMLGIQSPPAPGRRRVRVARAPRPQRALFYAVEDETRHGAGSPVVAHPSVRLDGAHGPRRRTQRLLLRRGRRPAIVGQDQRVRPGSHAEPAPARIELRQPLGGARLQAGR